MLMLFVHIACLHLMHKNMIIKCNKVSINSETFINTFLILYAPLANMLELKCLDYYAKRSST